MALFAGGNVGSSTGLESDPRSPIRFSAPQQEPVYVDVLSELKRRSLESGGDPTASLSLPLAPMQTFLQNKKATPISSQLVVKKKGQAAVESLDQVAASPNAIRERAQKSLDDSEKRLKAIEDLMWQHRQKERNLKRAETDIVQQQKHMQRSLKQFENKISKRQTEEKNVLLDKEAKFNNYWQKDLHLREGHTRDKIHTGHVTRQKLNEDTKKFMKHSNELTWRYQNLMELLDRKRNEMEELSKEFEVCIRKKEEEQHQMKQELASLAITLNMDAQKKRHQESDAQRAMTKAKIKELSDTRYREDNLHAEETVKHQAEIRHEEQQRLLEHDLHDKSELVKSRQRQEGRNLADVRTRLQHTTETQRYMQQEIDYIHSNILNEDMKRRIDVANTKRKNKLHKFQQRVRDRNTQELKDWAGRALSRENEIKQRGHEDNLKQLSKLVSRHDTVEHSLFSQAREADSQRKKKSQLVATLQSELDKLKQKNARKLKEAAVEALRTEEELHQRILKENAELSKAINIREESKRSLHVHQNRNREDRKLLNIEKKEHDRRVRIADRSHLRSSVTV